MAFKFNLKLISIAYDFLENHILICIILLLNNLFAVLWFVPLIMLFILTILLGFGVNVIIYLLVTITALMTFLWFSIFLSTWLSIAIYNALAEEEKYFTLSFGQVLIKFKFVFLWLLKYFQLIKSRNTGLYTHYVLPIIIIEEKPIEEAIEKAKQIETSVSAETLIKNYSASSMYMISTFISVILGIVLAVTGTYNIYYCIGITLFLAIFISLFFSVTSTIIHNTLYIYYHTAEIPEQISLLQIILRNEIGENQDNEQEQGYYYTYKQSKD